MCVLFASQTSSTRAWTCGAPSCSPVSWCLPIDATLLCSTVKPCQLAKLLCTQMWVFNIKQNNKTKPKKIKKPAPEHISKCLNSECTEMLLLPIPAPSAPGVRATGAFPGWASSRRLAFRAKGQVPVLVCWGCCLGPTTGVMCYLEEDGGKRGRDSGESVKLAREFGRVRIISH